MIYAESTSYCPVNDCEVTRLSTTFDHGGPEYFTLIPRDRVKTRRWRDIRDDALRQIDAAMQIGAEPGYIPIRLDA